MVRRIFLSLALVAVLLDRRAPATVQPASAPAWTPIESTTFDQRQATDRFTKPAEEPLLVLPFVDAAPSWPPQFVAAGDPVGPFDDAWRIIDRVVPRRPIHEEYFAKRDALAKDGLALVDWCRKNRLDECAEFEAARRMDEIDDFQKPEYGPYLERWLAIRDREQLAVSVPLPLDGEWFVSVDATHHHRKKAYAAYAFDMIQKVGDKAFRGTGTSLDDYPAFGKPIVAQADGVIVSIDDDFPDNVPGKVGAYDAANSIIVDYGGGVLADYGHLKHGSAAVKAGERVVRGQRLAAVGNSGASGMPHLHFTMIDWAYLSIRGRFHGEVKRGTKWVAFDGQDLEPGTLVRNRAPETPPKGH